MNITYTARKVTLRDNFKERVEKKLKKFERVFSENAQVTVVVTLEKNRQTVELTINDNGMIYRVENTQPEMNDALDRVAEILARKLRKNKTKLSKKLKASSIDDLISTQSAEPEEPEEETDFRIVRHKQIPVKPITVDEAILEMNMVNHNFYMFTNAETNEVNVVYLRDDGAYGLLEPNTADE